MQEPTRSRASELRLSVARQIADVYSAEPSVVAVVCTGSTARGQADQWSDLELLVVWESIPRDEQRRGIIAAVDGRDGRSWTWNDGDGACYDEWWDGGSAGHGLLVEVTHTTYTALVTRIDALVGGDADSPPLTLGDAIVNGVPLVDRADLTAWRSRLSPYPRGLAATVVRRYGQIDHFWRWQMYVERDNPLQLGVHFADVAVRCVHMTCALSGMWWPGAKWLMSLAAQSTIAPADFANRLQRIPKLTPSAAAATMEALVHETYDLVEAHLPEVDVARLRAIFHFARHSDESLRTPR